MDPRIPIYLITGFLDSGKTTLLKETLNMDYFNDGERTLLLLCEDGEVEFDPEFLKERNVVVIPIEDQSLLCNRPAGEGPADGEAALQGTRLLEDLDRRYSPERVLMEYNGMWPMQILRDLRLPRNWGLYQEIDMVDGSTFEMYSKNNNLMSMALDMISDADLVIFNRCTEEMPMPGWKRTLRAINKMCQVVFEDDQGEEFQVEEILPYSLETDPIVVEDEDFAIWFVDVQDHPERYENRRVSLLVQVRNGSKLPPSEFVGIRRAMTCCEADIRPFGYLVQTGLQKKLPSKSWVRLTATIRLDENNPAYDGPGVVLVAEDILPAQPPANDLVYFR